MVSFSNDFVVAVGQAIRYQWGDARPFDPRLAMPSRSLRCRSAALVVAAATAGCVVLPVQVYVPAAGESEPFYESCSLTPHLPAGATLKRPGLSAVVSIVHSQGVTLVRVQFDVPEGSTLVLRETAITVAGKDGTAPRRATIPHVNPAAPARYPETPAIQKLVLPVDTPLHGGRIHAGTLSFDRHYWIAAPFDGDLGSDVRISLPEFSLDGTPARFSDIHFTRRFAIGRAWFNC